jgi:hypothetical protein
MPNSIIAHPLTGDPYFGRVPEYRTKRDIIPEGLIILLQGRHNGPNRGFGARHIWSEHSKEMLADGFETEDQVSHYVARIVCAGTPLFFEASSWRSTRIMAVRSLAGTAILELRQRRTETVWSVVTAFSANKKHGIQIGTVL